MLAVSGGNSPLRVVTTDSGAHLGVDPLAFEAWWSAVHPDDRASFTLHRGTTEDARFVCAYDYLRGRREGLGRAQTIIEAWAAAVESDPKDRFVQTQAARAWERDAIIDLIDRLDYRDVRVAYTRIANRYTAIMEGLLEGAAELPVKDRVAILDTVSKFMKQISVERQAETAMRNRRSMLKALDSINQNSAGVVHEPTEDEIRTLVAGVAAKLGREAVLEMLEP